MALLPPFGIQREEREGGKVKSGHFLFLLGKVEEEEAWLGGLTESQGRTKQLFKEELKGYI